MLATLQLGFSGTVLERMRALGLADDKININKNKIYGVHVYDN